MGRDGMLLFLKLSMSQKDRDLNSNVYRVYLRSDLKADLSPVLNAAIESIPFLRRFAIGLFTLFLLFTC